MPKSDSVKTVKRSIDILNLLAEDGSQVGVIELSKRLKMSQSTIYRILSTLAAEGYVAQDPRTEKYRLGLQGVILAGAGTSSFIGECLAPYLAAHLKLRVEAIPTTDLVCAPSCYLEKNTPTTISLSSSTDVSAVGS